MSERTALYRLFDAADALLYIGISKRFGVRWQQHAEAQPWWGEVDHQTVHWFPDRDTADNAEKAAIKAERPKYNIIHNGRGCEFVSADRMTGLPLDEHPLLTQIRQTRAEYDRARDDLFAEIRAGLVDAEQLPEGEKRRLGPSAIGRAAGFTREYIAIIRGKRIPRSDPGT